MAKQYSWFLKPPDGIDNSAFHTRGKQWAWYRDVPTVIGPNQYADLPTRTCKFPTTIAIYKGKIALSVRKMASYPQTYWGDKACIRQVVG